MCVYVCVAVRCVYVRIAKERREKYRYEREANDIDTRSGIFNGIRRMDFSSTDFSHPDHGAQNDCNVND